MTVSVERSAVRHPLFHANCAIAEPSSCATLPKLNASLPFAPNRLGPIWSVPMHGATVSRPWLIDSCTTGAARSTSHVVKMIFAPWPISLSAQAFATGALLPCVSHVLISSGWPRTPPRASICLTRICAAASAGPSNGAIGPVESCAQPMTIGEPALTRAAAVAASATSAAAATSRATPARTPFELTFIWSPSGRPPRLRGDGDGGFATLSCDEAGVPAPLEALERPLDELLRRLRPQRAFERGAEAAVVGEQLQVVRPLPAGLVERAQQARQVGDAVAGEDPVGPAAARLAVVGDVDAGEAADVLGDVVEDAGRVPQVPRVELDAERRRVAGVPDQLDRLPERGDDRPLRRVEALVGLERDRQPEALRLAGERAQAVGDGRPRVVRVAAGAGAGQADDPGRPERREPLERGAERLHAGGGSVGAAKERQGQDRRDRGHRRGRGEAARLEELERLGVAAVRKLQLPDADPEAL